MPSEAEGSRGEYIFNIRAMECTKARTGQAAEPCPLKTATLAIASGVTRTETQTVNLKERKRRTTMP